MKLELPKWNNRKLKSAFNVTFGTKCNIFYANLKAVPKTCGVVQMLFLNPMLCYLPPAFKVKDSKRRYDTFFAFGNKCHLFPEFLCTTLALKWVCKSVYVQTSDHTYIDALKTFVPSAPTTFSLSHEGKCISTVMFFAGPKIFAAHLTKFDVSLGYLDAFSSY